MFFFWTCNKSFTEQARSRWLMVGLVLSIDRDFSVPKKQKKEMVNNA